MSDGDKQVAFATQRDERNARIEDTAQQCDRVAAMLRKIKRGHVCSDTDGMIVRRLIRLLVGEWV